LSTADNRAGNPAGNPGEILVCPTSHLDWAGTFAEYTQLPTQPGPYTGGAIPILETVRSMLDEHPEFRFSLAEIGFLRAFVAGHPERLASLTAAGPDRFVLLGGGITSPDNLVCHGEVFIRNYLLGREWLRSAGLAGNVAPAAWLPDDFGHDPQLPIVLNAMGLKWLGLSRVPGSPQPFPNEPLQGDSMADELDSGGLVFAWTAGDGSYVLTHFMPCTYGKPWDGSDITGLAALVAKNFNGWPQVNGGPLLFAPAGGDFTLSRWNEGQPDAGNWLTLIDEYNSSTPDSHPVARPSTFKEYMTLASGSLGLARAPLQAQNYWTGIFATRPRIKMLHYRAAQLILAAEAASTLVRLTSTYSGAMLDDLDAAIERAWQTLVPSSHHDYVTGTSPDRVYWAEQLPMLEQAAGLGEQCLTRAVGLIAAAVPPGPGPAGTSVVVFNPLGSGRFGIVELPAEDVPGPVASVSFGPASGLVQQLSDGGLLFSVPREASVDSFGYTTATLAIGTPPTPPDPPAPSNVVLLHNGFVTAQIDRDQAWAITSLVVDDTRILVPGGTGNAIRIYYDTGNLYQFGNEPLRGYPPVPPVPGTFSDTSTAFTGLPGEWLEWGPVRWHFRAGITGQYGGQPVSYTLDYIMYADEGILRMHVTGSAPSNTSVLTSFDLGGNSAGLTYGTASHYDDLPPEPYWHGPTFRGTHDFALTTGAYGPGLAIYHQSVPAWAVTDDGHLLGALLRNTPGTDRGAAGSDDAEHTVEYAVGSAGYAQVSTGEAIRTALAVSNPLVAAPVVPDQPADSYNTLPSQASLAMVTHAGFTNPPAAILRAARTRPGHTAANVPKYYAERFSFILRLYLPDMASVDAGPVVITLPDIPQSSVSGYDPDVQWVEVTALEEPRPGRPPAVSPAPGPDGTFDINFLPQGALTTLQVTVTRTPTQPASGK
jgi:alpha-mannosidase